MLNIAERIKARYETTDFESDYSLILAESFHNEKHEMINRIIELFNVSNYETKNELSNWQVINRQQAGKIFDFINDNLESFQERFSGHYVGYTSLNSVSFGEQEEQLEGLRNHKTGKDYPLPYLRKVFNDADFYVNDNNYAYYEVSGGLHIDLLKGKELLNEFLLSIMTKEQVVEKVKETLTN